MLLHKGSKVVVCVLVTVDVDVVDAVVDTVELIVVEAVDVLELVTVEVPDEVPVEVAVLETVEV